MKAIGLGREEILVRIGHALVMHLTPAQRAEIDAIAMVAESRFREGIYAAAAELVVMSEPQVAAKVLEIARAAGREHRLAAGLPAEPTGQERAFFRRAIAAVDAWLSPSDRDLVYETVASPLGAKMSAIVRSGPNVLNLDDAALAGALLDAAKRVQRGLN